jgi:two-component system phosphate regulon sensor histidine kinase PhoR
MPALAIAPGVPSQAAERMAALTARGARTACAMIHLVEGRNLRLIAGFQLPSGFEPMQQFPVRSTLAGIVMRTGFPVVVDAVDADERVPVDAPIRAAGIQCYAGFPVRDPAGAVVGVCAVMDYQARHWSAEQLTAVDDAAQACTAFVAEQHAYEAEHHHRQYLDTLLDSLDTGVAACDADGNLVLVNRSLRDRLGIHTVEGTVEHWARHLPLTTPDGALVEPGQVPLLRALHGTDVHGIEYQLHTREGPCLFKVNAHAITDRHGQRLGAVALFHDITEVRRAEQLQQALSRSKDDYLNLVGHELRIPLMIIGNNLELAGDTSPDTPAADLLPMIAAARRGSERLRHLVEALLDLSALDAGRAQLTVTEVDLVAVVTGTARDLDGRAAAKCISLTQTTPARLLMLGDLQRLTQLVSELLDNAVTYTPDGGAVSIAVTSTETTVTIEVADTGPGIPEPERPHVFDRFFRGAIATELAIPGAGLGLAIAKLITERHHGTITIVPTEYQPGTLVHVALPRNPAEPSAHSAVTHAA